MKILLALIACLLPALGCAAIPTCPTTVGALTLSVTQPRTSGISPFLAFFNATATTTTAALSGAGNTTQDVYYSWSFGDAGTISGGSTTWTTGATGQNLKNFATGPVAAHLYTDPVNYAVDVTDTVQVWAKVVDASTHVATIATCTVTVTVLSPSGANGFPGTATICAFNSTVGTGCPSGAATVTASTLNGALTSFGSGKRVLLKCGDTFTQTASYNIASGTTKATIGAYGGCENTGTNRPILTNTGGGTDGIDMVASLQVDIRITDLDLEGNGVAHNAIDSPANFGETQITVYNNLCHGYQQCYFLDEANQSGFVGNTMNGFYGSTAGNQGVFYNYFGNRCVNGSSGTNCSPAGTTLPCNVNGAYCDIRYGALIGNFLDGVGTANTSGVGSEVVRIGACIYCVVSNNTMQNANNVGSLLKFINGLPASTWIGQYTEYCEVSDNLFTGKSGTVPVETAQTNSGLDERLRLNIIERNLFIGSPGASGTNLGATKLLVSAQNETVRDNVFFTPANDNFISDYDIQVSQLASVSWVTQTIEVYNNTCYALTAKSGCVGFISGDGTNAAGINSWAQNNLFYNNGSANAPVNNGGTGNTVNSNSVSGAPNPNMKNGSGLFNSLGDFLPQANATGATTLTNNMFDAYQLSWTNAYQLGALSPAAP